MGMIILAVMGLIVAPVLANDEPVIPEARIPGYNRQFDTIVALGKQLFFDRSLSRDNTMSCASCHDPKRGFSDPRRVPVKVGGVKGRRNVPSLINVAYNRFFYWDGRATSLEKQALMSIEDELGMPLAGMVERLNGIPKYTKQFQDVFGTAVTVDGIASAIAAFERTIISTDSPFDRFIAGDKSALSEEAQAGFQIFKRKGRCRVCHELYSFSDHQFHNIGVPSVDPDIKDLGRYEVTEMDSDRGAFKTTIPHNRDIDRGAFKTTTLHNVAQTAPYMHNGAFNTLEEVVEFYDKGGGSNPNLSTMMTPLDLKPGEKKALVEFLKSLTGNLPSSVMPGEGSGD